MTADVTREPTGGQELRKAVSRGLWETDNAVFPAVFTAAEVDELWSRSAGSPLRQQYDRRADALIGGPLATLLADADNWRRVTTGDPTQPEPLAMQARTLLARVRELEATVTRVRELHISDGDVPDPGCDGCRAECWYCEGDHAWPCPTIRALDGEPQP